MQTAAEHTEMLNIHFRDWQRTRSVDLEDVVRSATVAEIVEAAREALNLPLDTSYQAVLDGRALNSLETLKEAGIEMDAEMELIPEVHAG